MARPTRLRVAGERPYGADEIESGSPMAEALGPQYNMPRTEQTPVNTEIVDFLRAQVAEKEREAAAARQQTAQAEQQIAKAYEEATIAVRQVEAKREVAEHAAVQAQAQAQQKASFFTTIGLNIVKQLFDRLTWFVTFLVLKLPALAALYGGFLLWQQSLANLSTPTLVALSLYGALIVLPCVWLASRPQSAEND